MIFSRRLINNMQILNVFISIEIGTLNLTTFDRKDIRSSLKMKSVNLFASESCIVIFITQKTSIEGNENR